MRAYTLAEALRYGHGNERPFLCPVHGDSRPSASVNLVKKRWYCYTCGARGGLTGEAALIEPDYDAMKSWLEEKLEEGRVYPESWLARYDAGPVHPYWADRVGVRAARHFRLGYDADADAVTYPLRDPAREVLGVVRRPLGVEEGPKYLYPRGVDVGRLLFNYSPLHRSVVVLCEGALDAVALWNVGVEAFAIYGAQIHPAQVALLDRIDPHRVVCAYDHDDAGWQAYLATEHALRHRLVERLTWPRSWGKDVDEIAVERRAKLVSHLVADKVSCVDCAPCGSSPASPRPTTSRTTSPSGRLSIRPRQN